MSAFTLQTTNEGTVLTLEGELTVAHAAELHREFSERFTPRSPLVIDAGRLVRIDASIIQVLLVAEPSTVGLLQNTPNEAWHASLHRYGAQEIWCRSANETPRSSA